MRLELLHLTDMHLLGDADARLHGWPVELAFERVLADAVRRYPNHAALILGGDLVDDESTAGYQRLNARLAAYARPVLAMAGNHDDPDKISALLSHAVVHGRLDIDGVALIALNSHVDGCEHGHVGAHQRDALARRLTAVSGPALVFVHHPPCALDSTWIDAMRLDDGDALLDVLAAGGQPAPALVCGHAHQAAQRRRRGVDCWVTPSTMRQFQPGSATFAEDAAAAPGYRWLRVDADGAIATRVHRVPGAAQACG